MESAEIERELEELESRVERLRALYEQYFMGIEKLEPLIARKDVDRRIWVLRRVQVRNTGMRFKFQMLIQRYNTFQQYWSRIVREIESGTYRRDVMRAAARVGEKEALTLVGKKRAKQFAALLETQAQRRKGHVAPAVEADVDDADVIEDTDLLVDDDAQVEARQADFAARRAWGDITEVMDEDEPTPPPLVRPERVSVVAAEEAPAPERADSAAEDRKPAGGFGGLRWGGAPKRPAPKDAAPPPNEVTVVDPAPAERAGGAADIAAKGGGRARLAELAAGVRKRTEAADDAPAPLMPSLDLDFEEEHTLPRKPSNPKPPVEAPKAASPEPRPPVVPPAAEPLPAAAAPASGAARSVPPGAPRVVPFALGGRPALGQPRTRRRSSRSMAAVRPPDAPTAAGAPAQEPRAEPPRAETSPKVEASPAAGESKPAVARPAAGSNPWEERTTPVARRPAPAAAPATPQRDRADDLSEQRIRQIYSKYVETKRSANESTAGMTFDKLAESLRAQATRLRASHPTKTVDYEVVVKDGKTMLKPILR
jgi:hypothetical protein